LRCHPDLAGCTLATRNILSARLNCCIATAARPPDNPAVAPAR
jgi:hypothetical protein